MNAGEPPDETGEDELEAGSTDRDGDASAPDRSGADPGDDEAVDGVDDDALDPDAEVEAAVEEALGPGVLDDGDDDEADASDSDGGGGQDPPTPADAAESDGDDPTGDGEGPNLDAAKSEADAAGAPADGEEVQTDDEPPVSDGEDGGDLAGGGSADGDDDGVAPAGEDEDDVSPLETDDDHRREEPRPTEAVEPDEEDGIDESAAVEAARELAEVDGRGDDDAGEDADDERPATADDAADGTAAAAAAGVGDVREDSEGQADGDGQGDVEASAPGDEGVAEDVPDDVRKYDRFKKIDGGTYDRANEFLRDRTYITAREWAMARLCADFRTETGVEMTKIGENLPELVPFMTDTYTPQAVNQARAAFEEKVRKAGATFLYGAMCDFFTAEELDDVMYEATEVAKFLLEVEGVELSVEEELAAEDHISEVMRDVREHSAALRHDEVTCPECGHEINADD